MDTAHAQAEQKKSTDMEDEDGDNEDTVSTRDIDLSSNLSLLQKKSSYFSLEEGKNEIYLSVIKLAEMQKEHGTRSGKLISHKQILTGMSRIFFSYLQVSALARSLPIAWPKEVENILETMATFSSPVFP